MMMKQPLANFITLLVIGISLALPALLWVFTYNLERITSDWKKEGHISLYLQQDLSAREQTATLIEVQKIPGIGQATLKTPLDGIEKLKQQEGMQDIVSLLPENPLPPVIDVVPALGFSDPLSINKIYQMLVDLPQVAQAKVDLAWVKKLHAIIDLAFDIVEGLMVLLAIAVILIISNTLRLSIQNRQDEIQVLKLVGAQDAYIIRPFLYSGIWYGLFGALISIVLIHFFLLSLSYAFGQLAQTYQMTYPFESLTFEQDLLLLIIAAILGWMAARLSVRRQLALIEPGMA
tara:strand:+ start:1254 stop:2123 length:870 start_codon:yes stop_codon:yes gene_type:complete